MALSSAPLRSPRIRGFVLNVVAAILLVSMVGCSKPIGESAEAPFSEENSTLLAEATLIVTSTHAPEQALTPGSTPTPLFQVPGLFNGLPFLEIAPDNDSEFSPLWSPQGDYVAYTNRYNCDFHEGGNGLVNVQSCEGSEIFLARADGSGAMQLTRFGQSPFILLGLGAWHPDGSQIAFSYFASPSSPLLVGSIDVGEAMVRPMGVAGIIPIIKPEENQYITGFSWSPDNTRIAYSFATGQPNDYSAGQGGPSALVIATLEGEQLLRITAPSEQGEIAEPLWSPGGTWIAYYSDFIIPELSVLNVLTGESAIIDGGSYGFFWTNHNNWLINWQSPFESDGSQVLINVATMEKHRLPTVFTSASISPDGRWLVSADSSANNAYDLYLYDMSWFTPGDD